MSQAEAMKLDVDADSIVECGVDNRILNPYKYVWFCGTAATGETISQMTQKAPFKKCI